MREAVFGPPLNRDVLNGRRRRGRHIARLGSPFTARNSTATGRSENLTSFEQIGVPTRRGEGRPGFTVSAEASLKEASAQTRHTLFALREWPDCRCLGIPTSSAVQLLNAVPPWPPGWRRAKRSARGRSPSLLFFAPHALELPAGRLHVEKAPGLRTSFNPQASSPILHLRALPDCAVPPIVLRTRLCHGVLPTWLHVHPEN
jgi:hypothetical protein